MNKFSLWLESNPGMATRLHTALDVNATNVSNWRHGRKPIPWKHMPAIAKMSRGKVPLKELMSERQQTVYKQ